MPESKTTFRNTSCLAGGRWTLLRKTKVVRDIVKGILTKQDACNQFDLSLEEVNEWMKKWSFRYSAPRLEPRVVDGYRPRVHQ